MGECFFAPRKLGQSKAILRLQSRRPHLPAKTPLSSPTTTAAQNVQTPSQLTAADKELRKAARRQQIWQEKQTKPDAATVDFFRGRKTTMPTPASYGTKVDIAQPVDEEPKPLVSLNQLIRQQQGAAAVGERELMRGSGAALTVVCTGFAPRIVLVYHGDLMDDMTGGNGSSEMPTSDYLST